MAKRGPKSAASLEITKSDSIEAVARPDAPYDLTDEQSQEWWAVVERLPADWFPRETHGVLAQYCRHVIAARRVAQLVAACEADKQMDIQDYDRLLKMQEREGRALSAFATRLRLTPQSTIDQRVKKPSQVKKPWQA